MTRRGFTLTEILVAVILFAVASVAIVGATLSTGQGTRHNRERSLAIQVGKTVISETEANIKLHDVTSWNCGSPRTFRRTEGGVNFEVKLAVTPYNVANTNASANRTCSSAPDMYGIDLDVSWTNQQGNNTESLDTIISKNNKIAPILAFLTATPPEVLVGQSTRLDWDIVEGTPPITYTITPGVGTVQPYTHTVTPTDTTTYTVTATNEVGSNSRSIRVKVNFPPVIRSFTVSNAVTTNATNTLVDALTTSTLNWDVAGTGPVTYSITNVGDVSSSTRFTDVPNSENDTWRGTRTVSPEFATTYQLTATSPYGRATRSVTVNTRPVIRSFTTNIPLMRTGQTAVLSWTVVGATNRNVNQGVGNISATGTRSITPTGPTTYTLTASSSGGTVTRTVFIDVGNPPNIVMRANPTAILRGSSANLTWQVTGVDTSQQIDNAIGTVPVSGSRSVSPTGTTIYTLTAVNRYGSASGSVTLGVNEPPPPGTPTTPVIPTSPTTAGLPVIQLSTNRTSAPTGTPIVIGWTISNSTSQVIRSNNYCNITWQRRDNYWTSGNKTISTTGNASVIAFCAQTYTFTISATNSVGTSSESVTVRWSRRRNNDNDSPAPSQPSPSPSPTQPQTPPTQPQTPPTQPQTPLPEVPPLTPPPTGGGGDSGCGSLLFDSCSGD
jgi:prepilin-type N-terminal cleavage/methylation domain-containing protein